MSITYLPEIELRQKLVRQSHEAIKTLIQSADQSRRKTNTKPTDYLNSFFKEAKKHIA